METRQRRAVIKLTFLIARKTFFIKTIFPTFIALRPSVCLSVLCSLPVCVYVCVCFHSKDLTFLDCEARGMMERGVGEFF